MPSDDRDCSAMPSHKLVGGGLKMERGLSPALENMQGSAMGSRSLFHFQHQHRNVIRLFCYAGESLSIPVNCIFKFRAVAGLDPL
jgi:hypothetical protein